MTLLDANVLIYAADADAPEHPRVTAWLLQLFQSEDPIVLPWPTVWAFVRISTDRRIHVRPRSPENAVSRIQDWLRQPGVKILEVGPRHLEIFGTLIKDSQASGPLVSDAVLAALAIEHGATLASTDRDFSRFPNLKWVNPLDAA